MTASFSVLLSIYYKEDPNHLNEALQSIWDNQTIKPHEIILVKDGPLTVELELSIKKWEKKLGNIFKVVSLSKNVGLGRALNEGIKHCSNDWIFRMDTDDIAASDRFEKQILYLEEHPEIVLLGGQIQEFRENINNKHKKRLVPLDYKEIMEYSKKRSAFNHPSVAYRKDVIEKVGGYQHHLLMEDYNLWIRILSAGYQVANIPDFILYMRTDNMIYRRRGWNYVKSEWQLFKLKKKLKFQNTVSAFSLFLIRSSIRLLPGNFLQVVYKFVRK